MGPRLSLPHLHPVKNLHRTAVRGDKMERERDLERGETWGGESGEKSEAKSHECCLLILAWLVMKRGCNKQWTKLSVQSVLWKHFLWCSMLNFPNICSAIISDPPTKHQHVPQFQLTSKTGCAISHRSQFSHTDKLPVYLKIKLFEFGGKKWKAKQNLCEMNAQVWRRLSGSKETWCFRLSECEHLVCFMSVSTESILTGAMKKIKSSTYLQRKIDSSAAEGCQGCQVPVGLHCKSTH